MRRKGPAATYRFGYGMKWVTWLFIATGVLWAAAIVLWLVAGGRVEFTAGSAPWSWQVLVPAWMTLTGIVLALGGCVVFAQQICSLPSSAASNTTGCWTRPRVSGNGSTRLPEPSHDTVVVLVVARTV